MANSHGDFLALNIKIVNALKDKFCKGKRTVKNGYVRFEISQYNVYRIVVYATNDNMYIETRVGCLPLGGLDNTLLSCEYAKRDDIKSWTKQETNTYVKKTKAFLTALIELSNNTQFFFEAYSLKYNWESIILNFVKNHDSVYLDEGTGIITWTDYEKRNFGGCYAINAFLTYITEYSETQRLEEHTEFLKKLVKMLNEKEDE